MKTTLISTVAVIALLAVYAFNNPRPDFTTDKPEGIQFLRGSWDEALQLAKKENKLIFLDIYATWCGPCKRLKEYTFSNKEVANFYNANFINITLDGEQDEGAALASRYGLTGYPSLLFIYAKGNLIQLTSGYMDPAQLLQTGKSVSK
ncbi:thioredoxin family protein [Ferruginibacter paludis]|uniref:thioredoxin family protein n=1 Tax=Ferruginibacter paludis TaxID=1310417 RepID=UPI0025B58CE2|nr:thioredoxin family protein [Ferruginibacter paludis]MDN3656676.1 thioredoxin family protein [Ferruginibacter paludis]